MAGALGQLLLLFFIRVSLLLRFPPLLPCLPYPRVRLHWLLLLLFWLSLFLPPSPSGAGFPVGFGTVADPGPSAPPHFAPPVSSSSLFRPFDASAGPSGVFSSSSTSAPPSGIPPPPVAPLGSSFSSSAPGPSFAPPQPGPEVPDDASFDPVFADPSAVGP